MAHQTKGKDRNFIDSPDNFRSKSGSAQKQNYAKGQGRSGSVAPKREGDKCMRMVKHHG